MELTSASGDYDYDDTIAVLVGKGAKRFTVHKDIICAKSKFFRAACSSRWQEGQEKVIRLPEARSVQAFQTYMDWTHTNELIINKAAPATNKDIVNAELIDLYLLGDVLDDVKLRNKTLRLLATEIKESSAFPSPYRCNIVWDNTPSNSSIRKCLADYLATKACPASFRKHGAKFPADLVLQALGTFIDRRDGKEKKTLDERMESYLEVEDDA
jgi:hypothetical protein